MTLASLSTLSNLSKDRLRRYATFASASVAFILIIAKLIAYLLTGSVAMLSSLLDSTVDLVASLVTVYGVASALRPPDHNHRFGHGKAEPLAALTQAAFIVGSSVLLIYQALSYFYHPHDIEHEDIGYGVMMGAIVLTMLLVGFQRYVVHKTQSMAIGADRLHYVGDLLINIAVIGTFVIYKWTGIRAVDPLFAILISCVLFYNASQIVRDALHVLMDRELPVEDRTKIMDLVRAHPDVRGVHDMRTRSDSERIFVEMHVEIDGDLKVRAAHKIIDELMKVVRRDYPHADVMIHQDPEGLEEERLDHRIGNNSHA